MKRFRLFMLIIILAGWLALFVWEAYPAKPTTVLSVAGSDVLFYDNSDNTILFLFGKQQDELSKSLLRSFINNGYSAYAAYGATPDNIPQIDDVIRTKTSNFGVIGVDISAQTLMNTFSENKDVDMLALVNPIISGNETVVNVNSKIPLLICYNTFSKHYDEQNTNELYNRLFAQNDSQPPHIKLALEEQVWHNYDAFVWRILTDCTEFAANVFKLPLTIERQELRTWYLFLVFFAIYLMCDFEIFKTRYKKNS